MNYQYGQPEPSNAEQYGLRAHNRRIVNPEMKFHTRGFYETRIALNTIARVTLFLIEIALIATGAITLISMLINSLNIH